MLFLILAQIVGFIGQGFFAGSGAFKKRKTILVMEAIGCLFFVAQWVFLNAPVAACMNLIFMYVSILGIYNKASFNSPYYFLAFPLAVIVTIISWTGNPWEILALTATLVGMGAKGFKHLETFRMMSIVSLSTWIIFAIVTFSIPTVLFNLIAISAHLKSLYKSLQNVYTDSVSLGNASE